MEDTYFSIAALELLGGLDTMDREACIKGILRLHQGKGFFTSPYPGGHNEYRIDGSAQDTFCAFESLRILGALSRVKDLDEWQFRSRRNKDKSVLTWDNIEAWVMQQRFEQTMRESKASQQTPFRSLLKE